MEATAPASPPRARTLRGRLANRLRAVRQLARTSEIGLTLIAAMVGVAAGVMVSALSRLVQGSHVILFGIDLNERLSAAAHIAPMKILIWPVVGGVLMGASLWLSGKLGRPGAVDPIEANALRGGRMSIRDSAVVTFQTLISSGFGASVGMEAGYTQAGSGFASLMGRWLNLRRGDLRTLVGAGAAASIAAAFGAPLTGAFYGFEVVIGAYTLGNVAPVMAACIAATLTTEAIGGALYSFEAHHPGAIHAPDYVAFIGIAVVCAGLAIAMMHAVSLAERLFRRKWLPVYVRPAIGGLAVGALGLITPQVLSAGHGALQYDILTNQSLIAIAAILVLKILASTVSLGSGFRGGLFFASLLLGALTGQAFALLAAKAGMPPMDMTSAALVGMGAFAVAIVGGPLTMSFLVLETTGDYVLTGAVLAASVGSSLIVRELFGYSFSTWRLHLRGESIRSAHDVEWIRTLTVGRLMRKDMALIPSTATIRDLREKHPLGSRQRVILVDEAQRYMGLVLLAEAYTQGVDEAKPALELARFKETALTPSLNVKDAMRAFETAEAEALAVVEGPENPRVIGMLNESFAVRRYAEELDKTRRDLIGEPE